MLNFDEVPKIFSGSKRRKRDFSWGSKRGILEFISVKTRVYVSNTSPVYCYLDYKMRVLKKKKKNILQMIWISVIWIQRDGQLKLMSLWRYSTYRPIFRADVTHTNFLFVRYDSSSNLNILFQRMQIYHKKIWGEEKISMYSCRNPEYNQHKGREEVKVQVQGINILF